MVYSCLLYTSREDESLVPLPMNKIDLIRSQVGRDWSKEIVPEATIDGLDSEAIAYARKMFIRREENSLFILLP